MATSTIKYDTYKVGTYTPKTGDANLVIRQSGRTVTINGYTTNTSLTAGTEVELGTVSGVALPNFNVRGLCGVAGAAYQHPADVAYITLGTNGKLFVNSTITGTRAVYFSLSYTA